MYIEKKMCRIDSIIKIMFALGLLSCMETLATKYFEQIGRVLTGITGVKKFEILI